MRERGQGGWVGEQRDDVGELRAAGGRVELRAHRMLHEGVRDDDEVRGQVHGKRDQPNRGSIQPDRDATPAKEPQAKEDGLHEEGHEAFQSEGSAEDVADHA